MELESILGTGTNTCCTIGNHMDTMDKALGRSFGADNQAATAAIDEIIGIIFLSISVT